MSPHILFVIRRFWPIQTGASRTLLWAARGLRRRGFRVTVLTPRWVQGWPAEFMLDDVRVIRPADGVTDWRTGRVFFRRIHALLRGGPLRGSEEKVDGVFVSGMRQEAEAVIRAVNGRVPVVLRPERSGKEGDCQWQSGRFRARRFRAACMKADAVVAPSRLIESELLAAGYDRARVRFIPHGVPIPSRPTCKAREEARLTLARAEPLASTSPKVSLAMVLGALENNKNLTTLLSGWEALHRSRRSARLWLVGDGSKRYSLLRRICSAGLESRILMPGQLSDVDDLLTAAHVLIQPSFDDCMSLAVLEAMAFARPVVAADSPGNREIVTHEETGLLFHPDSPESAAQALERIFSDGRLAERLGSAGRDRVTAHYSVERMIEAYAEVLGELGV